MNRIDEGALLDMAKAQLDDKRWAMLESRWDVMYPEPTAIDPPAHPQDKEQKQKAEWESRVGQRISRLPMASMLAAAAMSPHGAFWVPEKVILIGRDRKPKKRASGRVKLTRGQKKRLGAYLSEYWNSDIDFLKGFELGFRGHNVKFTQPLLRVHGDDAAFRDGIETGRKARELK